MIIKMNILNKFTDNQYFFYQHSKMYVISILGTFFLTNGAKV